MSTNGLKIECISFIQPLTLGYLSITTSKMFEFSYFLLCESLKNGHEQTMSARVRWDVTKNFVFFSAKWDSRFYRYSGQCLTRN